MRDPGSRARPFGPRDVSFKAAKQCLDLRVELEGILPADISDDNFPDAIQVMV